MKSVSLCRPQKACPGLTSGSLCLARELAERLNLAHIELDALYHQAGWIPRETESFRRAVLQAMAGAPEGWVMCGGHEGKIGDLRTASADTILWLDYPRWFIMSRLLPRTLRRAFTSEELWNGNREQLSNLSAWSPEDNILRWSWTTFHPNREKYGQLAATGREPLEVRRFRSAKAARTWLESIRLDG